MHILYTLYIYNAYFIYNVYIHFIYIQYIYIHIYTGSSPGKESKRGLKQNFLLQCRRRPWFNLIPGLRRSPGEGTGYPLQHSWASLVAKTVKNLPAMWETWV